MSCTDDPDKQPFIIVKNNIITEVSQAFVDMTKYSFQELINRNIEEVLRILRVGPHTNLERVESKQKYFFFTKYLEVRFINIEVISRRKEKIYIIREKANSRISDNNQFLDRLITENGVGIGIFTAKDLIMLKANERLLNHYPASYNKKEVMYGKSLKDIIPNFMGGPIEEAFNDIVNNNKSKSYKEKKLAVFNKTRYWNCTLTPIMVNGRVEYIVVMADDVTENVLNKKYIHRQSKVIEEKNKKLEAIFESIGDMLFILDKDGNVYEENTTSISSCLELIKNNVEFFDFNNNLLAVEDRPIYKVLKNGEKVKSFGLKLVDKEREKYIIINGTPIFNSDENINLGVFAAIDITELMEKEKQIKKQKELLENIIENTSNGVFIYDKNGKQLMVNKEAKKLIFPTDSSNVLKRININNETFYENGRIIPKGVPLNYCALNGEIINGEKVTIKEEKMEKVLEFKSSPIYDNDGNIDMLITYTHDITELVYQNKYINQQKELLESIIENMSDAMIVYDKDKNVVLRNEATKKIFYDYSNLKKYEDIFKTTKCLDIYGKEILQEELPVFRSFRGEKVTNFIMAFKRPDKKIHCRVSSKPIYDEYGKISNVVVCIHDITDLIEKEKQVQDQKELNNMQEAIIVFNKDGKYIIRNNVSIELLQTRVENVGDGYKVRKFFHLNGEKVLPEEMPGYIVEKGKCVQGKVGYFEENGKKEYVLANGVPITDSEGNFMYGIISCRSITEFMESQQNLKLAQEQLLKAEREKNETLKKSLEMKDEFLSLISHEFRTPINVISTAIQALNYICGNELSNKVKEYLGIIRQNNFRQLRLVNNLLDVIRANSGRIKINKRNINIVFLTKAIIESVYDYAAQKGVNVSLTSSFKNKVIAIDDEKYERVILNLISNAIKFTSEGNSIYVTLRSLKGKICVEVKDNGIGIPQDKLDVIFEKFGQVDSSLSRQAEGTGIGLSLVKMFVHALGGSISVKSKIGKGSTFTMLFPDKTVADEDNSEKDADFMNNRLIEVTNVEFSDIYL
ncbi:MULTISPECIES: PAS domain S-box protein [unclassified Clostridium]|uniref:PAS domain-containing sensor histidine kinase n=1 Tax=unclassified Clostridium TaxID=2614128 RepID=UPI000297ECC7|nr:MULTISPECIES: PAS domain S-box protein [unclassified Clostridium]EKQ58324.1 MAG: PAS domain S-box [Clostridium sp. Maddingley MBC34-26]